MTIDFCWSCEFFFPPLNFLSGSCRDTEKVQIFLYLCEIRALSSVGSNFQVILLDFLSRQL